MGFWDVFWLAWGALLVADFIAAKWGGKGSTLSEHIWGRWFPWLWRRVVFLGSWLVCGIHFACEGKGWYASGWMVALWLVVDAGIIVARERELRGRENFMGCFKSFAGKVWGGIKKAGGWVASNGPLFSSAILGASFAFPALKPIAAALGALLGGGGGGADPDLTKEFGELILGLISLFGVIRKIRSRLAAPALPPGK